MSPLLESAIAEAAPMQDKRGWKPPSEDTVAAAERLLERAADFGRAPQVQVEPDGRIAFEWEAAGSGWLTLTVDDAGRLEHRGVIDDDEYEQVEDFTDELPGWATALLARLLKIGH